MTSELTINDVFSIQERAFIHICKRNDLSDRQKQDLYALHFALLLMDKPNTETTRARFSSFIEAMTGIDDAPTIAAMKNIEFFLAGVPAQNVEAETFAGSLRSAMTDFLTQMVLEKSAPPVLTHAQIATAIDGREGLPTPVHEIHRGVPMS